MADFYIKKGDLLPAIVAVLKDENGAVIDLSTGVDSVAFHMVKQGSETVAVDEAATITDGPNGEVTYLWSGTDTDDDGSFFGEFEVTWTGGKTTTFPNYRFLDIKIRGEIA